MKNFLILTALALLPLSFANADWTTECFETEEVTFIHYGPINTDEPGYMSPQDMCSTAIREALNEPPISINCWYDFVLLESSFEDFRRSGGSGVAPGSDYQCSYTYKQTECCLINSEWRE